MRRYRRALATAAGMCLFALFALRPFPLFFIALSGLLVVAVLIARSAHGERSLGGVCGWASFSKLVGGWSAAGCFIGLLFALAYRWTYGLPLVPGSFTYFVMPAALIGTGEELVFRGYLQGRIRSGGWLLAPAFAASSHTLYKCALFVFPPEGVTINLPLLAALTFIAGLVLGLLRRASGNVLPAVAAHALFDVLVYGDRVAVPWWVWR